MQLHLFEQNKCVLKQKLFELVFCAVKTASSLPDNVIIDAITFDTSKSAIQLFIVTTGKFNKNDLDKRQNNKLILVHTLCTFLLCWSFCGSCSINITYDFFGGVLFIASLWARLFPSFQQMFVFSVKLEFGFVDSFYDKKWALSF